MLNALLSELIDNRAHPLRDADYRTRCATHNVLGWHFNNSSFAVTTLITPPESGGVFEFVPNPRRVPGGEENFDGVRGTIENATGVRELDFGPGDLVLFRGRNSMHRVTPSQGRRTRILIVFAFNTEEGIGLSDSAKETFYGRS